MSLLCVKLSSGSHLESKLKFDIWWTLMPCLLWRLSRHLWCRLLLSLHSFCFDRTAFLSGFYHVRQAFILKSLHKLLTPPGKLLPPLILRAHVLVSFGSLFISHLLGCLRFPGRTIYNFNTSSHLPFQHFLPPLLLCFSLALLTTILCIYLFIWLTGWLVVSLPSRLQIPWVQSCCPFVYSCIPRTHGQCLACSRYSVNIWWMGIWTKM